MDSASCLEARNAHGRYCVPRADRDRPAARAALRGRIYERATIDFIRANADDGDVVHGGTFFGDFLPALSRCTKGTVWAFEPNPRSRSCALSTIEMNGLQNVTLIPAAIGSSPEPVRFRTTDGDGRSLGGRSSVSDDGELSVDVARIDDVVPPDRRVSIIHLDVEGYEKNALEGARATIERHRPIVILENDTPAFLRSVGYRFVCRSDTNFVYGVSAPRVMPPLWPRIFEGLKPPLKRLLRR